MSALDELRRLDIKEVGAWPALAKGVVLAAIVTAILIFGAFFDWKEQWEQLEQKQQEEITLKEEFTKKKRQAINLDLYVQQLKDIEDSFGALLKQLPNKSEMDALIIDINQAGLGRGLQFDLFKPASQENISDFYAELPISIKLSGSYHDIGAFSSDVAQLPRIVTLNDINLFSTKEGLVLEALAKTFRYLDEEELAKQRKAAKEKAGKRN